MQIIIFLKIFFCLVLSQFWAGAAVLLMRLINEQGNAIGGAKYFSNFKMEFGISLEYFLIFLALCLAVLCAICTLNVLNKIIVTATQLMSATFVLMVVFTYVGTVPIPIPFFGLLIKSIGWFYTFPANYFFVLPSGIILGLVTLIFVSIKNNEN